MVKRIAFASLMILIILSFSSAFSEPNIKSGKWEITTETEMPGMPMKMPPVTHTQCMSKNDPIPQNRQPGQECQISNINMSGDTVTWTMICTNQGGKMEGKGKVTYKGDKMQGTMELVMEGGAMRMTSKMNGRRVGSCD